MLRLPGILAGAAACNRCGQRLRRKLAHLLSGAQHVAAIQRDGRHAGHQGVEHRAERIDVRTHAHGLPGELLGRGVFGRHRVAVAAAGQGEAVFFLAEQPCDAEIQQPHGAVVIDQDVVRLQIAVYHQLRVRVLHRRAHVQKQPHAGGDGEALFVAPCGDVASAHELQREPRATTLRHAAVDETRQMRVIQPCQNPPLAQETHLHIVEIEPAPDQLQRDFLLKVRTFALAPIHHAHAAAPNALDHAERAEKRADQAFGGGFVGFTAGKRRAIVGNLLQPRQQPAHPFGECGVVAALLRDQCLALTCWIVECEASEGQCAAFAFEDIQCCGPVRGETVLRIVWCTSLRGTIRPATTAWGSVPCVRSYSNPLAKISGPASMIRSVV